MGWYKIASHLDELNFGTNNLSEIQVKEKNICIIRSKSGLAACASGCPHAGGKLSEGFIDSLGYIVCPLHHYKFNVKNGINVSGEGYHVKTYAIEEREDGIYINIENKRLY